MRRYDWIHRPAIRLAMLGTILGSLMGLAALGAERVEPQSSGPASAPPPAANLPALPENAEEIQAQQGQVQQGQIVARRPARTLTPMMAEIMTFLEARDREVALKRQQLAAVRADRGATAALQEEMRQLKLDTELGVLRIQARHATMEGRVDDARRIEASIEERLHPKVRIAPEPRPLPQAPTPR
jgi:hypothetical protein